MSSMEIGSSATSTSGPSAMALAITARCFCPPESSAGYFGANRSTGASPTRSRADATRPGRCSAGTPWIRSASEIAWSTVIDGFSAACGSWKIICSFCRSGRIADSPRPVMSRPR